jgi:TolA-binding protein
MNFQNITATKLRLILAVSLLGTALLASVFVVFASGELKKYAEEVSRIASDASISQDNIQRLNKIQQELLANKDAIERTNDIVADSQSYQYQDQIITDITDYANRADIDVTNIDFLSAQAATSGTPATTPPAGGTSTAAPTGVKSTTVSITLKNPLGYEKLLRFIKSIEENLTKMQISRVGFAKDEGGNVTSEVLNIEVYIR